jgi:hypothetical protein
LVVATAALTSLVIKSLVIKRVRHHQRCEHHQNKERRGQRRDDLSDQTIEIGVTGEN